MEILELPPTRLDLPGGEEPAYIATQSWALEPWEGEDPPELSPTWSRKGKFSVNGSRSCAELAVLHHLQDEGWHGIWVNAYGPGDLRSDWFPAPAAKAITQTQAPAWAAEIFEDLRAANSGKLGGFFDIFAWREPGEVRFDEVKVGRDPIGINQRKFVKLALGLGRRLDEFMIIKVLGRPPQREVDGGFITVGADQTHEPDLEEQLKQAIENYRTTWSTADSELYDLCRRRPSHRSFADVYAKVAIIGRVYAAGLSRSSRASGDAETAVTRGLMSLADMIEVSLAEITERPLDRKSAAQIVELHGRVARGLLPHTGETWQQSFVSKYLHFHCDIVPIYDSNAQEAIGNFVDWQTVTALRDQMANLPDWARAYRNFVAAFVVLRERISNETSTFASVKEIDHLLWRSA